VIAIWLPVLAGDSRSAWPEDLFDDPRVTSLWDGERLAGSWFSDNRTGGLGGEGSIVWDAYLAYGPKARWQGGAPTDPVVAGSDIIANTGGLKQFAATLGS